MDNTVFRILLELNRYYINLITDTVITKLKKLRGKEFSLSGDDSGLISLWEEVCAQIQSGESIYWEAYLDTINTNIDIEISNLPKEIINVLNHMISLDQNENELSYHLIIKLIREQVLEKAKYFTNGNISNYLGEEDDEEEENEEE